MQVLGSNMQVTQALNNLEGDRAAQEKVHTWDDRATN